MRRISLLVAMFVVVAFLGGCLSVERKEYNWKINKDGSGSGKIVWVGLFSSGNTEGDESANDFMSLINDYYEGNTLEEENPGFKNVKKRLFMKDSKLCGEMTFDFAHYSAIGFYRHKNDGPYMYLTDPSTETFVETNGEWPGEDFPVIFWNEGTKEFKLVTTVGDVNEDGAVDLDDYFSRWEKTGDLPNIEEE